VAEGEPREIVDQARTALWLKEKDIAQRRENVRNSTSQFWLVADAPSL
jgi:hypothetical protein